MAVLAIFTADTTKDEYDALRKEVRWETDQPAGVVLHAASFDDAGHIHVADVWESAEQLNAFIEKRLVPAFQKLGFAPPNAVVYPAHNVNVFKTADQFKI